LGDVSALAQHGHAQLVVFDPRGTPQVMARVEHDRRAAARRRFALRYHRGMVLRSIAAAAVLLCAVLSAAGAPQPPDKDASPFPPGTGRDALIKVCSGCHGAESAVAQFKTHDEWVKTLDEMANNGAQGSDEEWTRIQAYLDKHFSLIFINKDSAE